MSPNGISTGFDKILFISSSDSSDSESLLQEDVKSGGSEIKKQWEAIERTLYQESGQQVTDTDLLKECKLWRETFPHFRVRGTKIDIKETGTRHEAVDKNMQTSKNHFSPKKLDEKRESIKTKVVGMLVDRLIAKYGPDKESANSGIDFNSGVQKTKINKEFTENFSNPSPKTNVTNTVNRKETSTVVSTDNESYFERGKLLNRVTVSGENSSEIFHSWERNAKTAKKLQKSYQTTDLKKLENQRNNFVTKYSEKPFKERFKSKKFTPLSYPLGDVSKHFEMTKKIDKKYEGLVDRIFECTSNEMETIRHCPTSASELEMKNFQESLQKLRIGSGFNEFIKRNSNSRLNNFHNTWLRRREMNCCCTNSKFPGKNPQNIDLARNLYREGIQDEVDVKFIGDFKRVMALGYRKQMKRSGVIEGINLKRPIPFKASVEKTSRSISCGDLQKKNKKETKGRQPKSELGTGKSEPNLKKTIRYSRPSNNKGSRSTVNQNPLLPPIESGIICTELTGRPKIGHRVPTRRF